MDKTNSKIIKNGPYKSSLIPMKKIIFDAWFGERKTGREIQQILANQYVELAETKDKTDYNLCAWTEIAKDYVQPEFNTSSNLAIWWQESGGTLREFQEKMRRKPFLNDYEVQNLKNAGINVKKDMTFLRMSKALLGQCIFSEITGTMNMLERTEQLNSPYRYLIGAVHNEIKNTAKEQPLFPEENHEYIESF